MSITIKGRVITARHVGLLVVLFALGVTIPRLVFAFALSDNLVSKLGEQAEFTLLMTSAVMGAVVLTTGNAFLSHILADNFQRRDALWTITAAAWGVNLLFAVFIIAPTLMVGMQDSPLASILRVSVPNIPTGLMQWAWCITAALAFELLAAGSMAAYAIASRTPTSASAPQAAPVVPLAPVSIEVAPVNVPAIPTLDELDARLLDIYRANPAYPRTQAAQEVGASRQTVSNRLAKLQERGLVVVSANGNGAH